MTTDSSKKKTPELILDTAQELILARGFHGVSVDTIIEQSGVSKGTFFYHFKSKEVLAERLLQRFIEEVSAQLGGLLDEIKGDNLSDYDTVIRFLDLLPQRLQSMKGCLMAAFSYQLINESPALADISRSAINGWKAFFAPLFEKAMKEKNVTLDFDTAELAQTILCTMEGAFITARIGDPNALATQFKHLRQYIELLALPAKG